MILAGPLASLIIPVRNEAANIRRCLDAVFRQRVEEPFEVIVIDSGSTDGTLKILEEYPVRVHRIPASEFGHGRTRQLGVSLARGRFVVFTVADAEPADERWLELLVRPLLDDDTLAASYGVQAVKPVPGHDPIARNMLERGAGFRGTRQRLDDPSSFGTLPPLEQRNLSNFDDCTSCIRRELLERFPLPDVSYAEDFLWCRKMIESGYGVAFVKEARIYHYHRQSFGYAFKRNCYDQVISSREFGLVWCPSLAFMLDAMKRTQRDYRDMLEKEPLSLPEKAFWLFYNLKVDFARNLGFLAGAWPGSLTGKFPAPLNRFVNRVRDRVIASMEGKPIIHE